MADVIDHYAETLDFPYAKKRHVTGFGKDLEPVNETLERQFRLAHRDADKLS